METGCCVSGGSRRSKAASVRLCPCSKISLSMRVEYSKRGIVTCEERRQVVVQFDKLASQTRDYCVARNATLRAARPDPSLRKERLLKDDNQTAQLPANITGGGRVAATRDNSQSICTSPDPVCTVTSGPPPRTLPRTALCSWRTSPCNVMVTGWSTTTLPEPVDAPRSNAACSGSLS